MSAFSEPPSPPPAQHGPAEAVEASRPEPGRPRPAVPSFPPSQQEAVRLKFLQQFSYREIAEVMGLSESHVGVLIHTAMKKLRQAFAEPLHTPAGVPS